MSEKLKRLWCTLFHLSRWSGYYYRSPEKHYIKVFCSKCGTGHAFEHLPLPPKPPAAISRSYQTKKKCEEAAMEDPRCIETGKFVMVFERVFRFRYIPGVTENPKPRRYTLVSWWERVNDKWEESRGKKKDDQF